MESLIRQHGTVNRLAVRAGISREVVTKMRHGYPCRLDVLERFVENLSLSLSEWRVLCGYAPLPSESAPVATARSMPVLPTVSRNGEFRADSYFLAGIRQLGVMLREPIPVPHEEIPSESATREEVDRALERLAERVLDARDRRLGKKSGEVEGNEGSGGADNGAWAA